MSWQLGAGRQRRRLIEDGSAIDGLTRYRKQGDRRHTFSPCFSGRNVGRLTAGL
ncbi:MAG TPA: hypothetical protein VH703_07325 [Solirubrobacterales bacterium]|jgi:hypothetical protein